jgi:hypothetical protein
MSLKDYREYVPGEMDISQNDIRPKVGDRVKIKDTLLYNDRTGVIFQDEVRDWDYHVQLDPHESDKIQHRLIGVHDDQVEVISDDNKE